MKNDGSKRKKYLLIIIAAAVGVALIGALTAVCLPFFMRLAEPEFQAGFREWVESLGFGGWLVMLAIQMIQVIVALIPGEPVELLAGVLYGAWGGLGTCLLGLVLASALVFFSVRKFGYPLVSRLFGEKRLREFKFLNNTKSVETATFVLFLIPGVPKDILTYVAGLSVIRPAQFLLISTLARIPSILSSTMMGATMSSGRWGITLVIFLLVAAIGLVGIRYKTAIISRVSGHRHNT